MFTGFIANEILFVILLSLSLVLITLEFFIPSFGIVGLTGGYLLIESILSADNFSNITFLVGVSLLISLIIITLIIKYFVRNMEKNKLVLNTSLKTSKGNKPKYDNPDLVGQIAIVHKTLRPSGEVMLNNEIYEAVSFGDYIGQNEEVIVEKIVASKLYVRKI